MKILWWFHLLEIIPSYYITRKCADYFCRDRKIPYILLLLFLADYIPLLFSEALYDCFFQLLVAIGWDNEYSYKVSLWLCSEIHIFITQYLSVYSWHCFWIFGIISVLLLSIPANNLGYYWVSLPGLFNSLSLLFYYSVSGPLEYFVHYFICVTIFIIWGFKIKYWITELNPVFYIYNISILIGTLLSIKNAFIPEMDLAVCIRWILQAGIVIAVPAMIFFYFCISFGSIFELLRSTNEGFCNISQNNNYLHNHEYVFCIFQHYLLIFLFVFAMILTARIFEEILEDWNWILVELLYLTAAATIGNALLYPNLNSNPYFNESLNVPMNILGIYTQFWFLRILANFLNNIWA